MLRIIHELIELVVSQKWQPMDVSRRLKESYSEEVGKASLLVAPGHLPLHNAFEGTLARRKVWDTSGWRSYEAKTGWALVPQVTSKGKVARFDVVLKVNSPGDTLKNTGACAL